MTSWRLTSQLGEVTHIQAGEITVDHGAVLFWTWDEREVQVLVAVVSPAHYRVEWEPE